MQFALGLTGALGVFAALMLFGSAACRRRPERVRFFRKSIHAAMGLASLTFPALAPATWQVLALSAAFIGALILFRLPHLRRRGFINVLSNPAGHPDGEFWFVAGVASALLLARHDPFAYVAAILILGIADPAAAGVGRRWGRVRAPGHPRTLEGSLAFALTALVLLGLVACAFPAPPLLPFVAVALAAACVEWVAPFGTDNMLVPLTVVALTGLHTPARAAEICLLVLGTLVAARVAVGFFRARVGGQ
jgi:phytol kinase